MDHSVSHRRSIAGNGAVTNGRLVLRG